MKPKIWTETYRIGTSHVDTNSLITPLAFLYFMQESAVNHADNTGIGFGDLIKDNKTWVLSRIKIEIYHYSKWKENIVLKTWINQRTEVFFSHRDFQFFDENGVLVASATESWAMIDYTSRRPCKLIDFIVNTGLALPQNALEQLPQKVLAAESVDEKWLHTTVYSDLDLHNHVNHVKYIEWILNSYSCEFRAMYKLNTLEINYLNEVHCNEKIEIQTQHTQGEILTSLHNLVNENQKDVCRAKVEWGRK